MPYASILRHARHTPHKPAIVISGRTTSYRQLAQLVCAARNWIERRLPEADGIFAVCCKQPLVDWVMVLALRSSGRTAIAAPDAAMPAQLGLKNVRCVITLPASDGAGQGDRSGQAIVPMPASVFADAGGIEPPADPDDRPFGDCIEFTSGTTGANKAILRTGKAQPLLCARTRREYEIGPETVFHFGNLPPWSSVGNKGPLTVWIAGGTCLFDFRRDWTLHVLEFPINRLFAPPRAIRELAHSQLAGKAPDLIVNSGGGFLAFEDARLLREKLGCAVYHHYAGTEFGIRLRGVIEREEDVLWLGPFGDPGIEIVDDDGNSVGLGRQGQIRIRLHECDPQGYLGNDGVSELHFRDGWFLTGDLAERREDGRIRIFGRTGDVLNLGGVKRAVGPFEARAKELLGVESLCLFTRQSDKGECFLLVAVEGEGALPQDRIAAFNRTFTQLFPQIELHQVASFPRSGAYRKVDRAGLMAMVQAAASG